MIRLALVLESNTDRRRVEGLAARTHLTVLARQGPITDMPVRADLGIRHLEGPADRARYLPWVVRSLVRGRFDAVVVDNYFIAALGANVASRLRGTPTLLQVRNPMESYYRCRQTARDPERPFLRRELLALQGVARLNARLTRRYATVSDHLGAVVAGHGARCPILTVPSYGVDVDVFRPSGLPRDVLRVQAGLPREGQLVLAPSRTAPEKDPETVLLALAQLLRDGRDVRLVVRAHDWIERRAAELGVGAALIMRPKVDPGPALAAIYQAVDVVVQSSRQEGFGMVPAEALACGTPVVASAVGGLLETVRDGITGWSFPVGDAEACAKAVAEALDDPEEAQCRTEAGRQHVHDRLRSSDALDRIVREALAAV